MTILLDSNILIYLLAIVSPFRRPSEDTVERLFRRGDRLVISLQNLLEFWVHATHPVAQNGMGLDPATARARVESFEEKFKLLPEASLTAADLLDLAVRHDVRGRLIHDARLVATMKAHGIQHILSYDAGLDRFSEITRIEPVAEA